MSTVPMPPCGASGSRLLAAEAATRPGTVPASLDGQVIGPGQMHLARDCMVLRSPSGLAFFYRKGSGVVTDHQPDADRSEEPLWLSGSLYAGIAAIHGYLPVHASAVAWNGRVVAFSGPSGAGKSTLVAALGQRGFPLFCDDTMVIDLQGTAAPLCLPGHKRLKLTEEALTLSGAQGEEAVSRTIAKRYAAAPAGAVGEAMPLACLAFLSDGAGFAATPITGAERILRLDDDHYTATLYAAARGDSPAARLQRLAGLATRMPMARIARTRSAAGFDAFVDAVADWIRTNA